MNNQSVECGCDEIPQSLLSTDQALTTLTNAAKVINATEFVALDEALGRILATNIFLILMYPDLITLLWMATPFILKKIK